VSLLLLDTSVWIEYLRDTGSLACQDVERLLQHDLGSIVTTPLVVMELTAGATTPTAVAQLEQLTGGLPLLVLDQALDFHAAAAAFRAARQQGATVRGLVDCLLAVVAQRHGATLVHRDADLARLAALLPGLATRDLR
jgi:predicted nucleic acid-binding protein